MKRSFEVIKLCLEVAPLNMEARDDINLSIQQLLNTNSTGRKIFIYIVFFRFAIIATSHFYMSCIYLISFFSLPQFLSLTKDKGWFLRNPVLRWEPGR